MSSEPDLSDSSLIDLFRAEVETHAEVLNSALLELERSPGNTSRINEMMRAAHSIKGASRIVGVDPAGRVAHVMEDCFVAAQKGTIRLASADVDVLLRGVDLLERVSAATKDPDADLESIFGSSVTELERELHDVLSGTYSAPAGAAKLPAATTESRPASSESGMATAAAETTIVFPETLNAEAAETVRVRIVSVIESGTALSILLDLSATRNLDVQGLALLAALTQVGGPTVAPVILGGVSPEMAIVLRVTGLYQLPSARRAVAPKAD